MDWISVEDRLPEDKEMWVDVWLQDGIRVVDVRFRKGWFWEQHYDIDGDYDHESLNDRVTHWMPLPEPPE